MTTGLMTCNWSRPIRPALDRDAACSDEPRADARRGLDQPARTGRRRWEVFIDYDGDGLKAWSDARRRNSRHAAEGPRRRA
jgi:hypothetical protein